MHVNIHFTQRSYPSKITIFLKQRERNGWSNFRRSSVLVIKEFCPLTVDGVMVHPSDGEAWKHFNSVHPYFSAESRNVGLGLCTDGFNPFGSFAAPYSCWPVILTVYNLPPGMCMRPEFIFLSMVIPGPSSPVRNIDVLL